MAILTVPRPADDADARTGSLNVDRNRLDQVISTEASHGTLGIIAGVLVIGLGALMIFGGFSSDASKIVIDLGDNSLELTSSVPGIFFALAGVGIIYITRPKVEYQ
jgi:hypothetical protein